MPDDRSPFFRRLQATLRDEIAARFAPGAQFLTQRAIMERYDASFSTVDRALRELVADGLLVRIHGKGTFVSERRASGRPLPRPTREAASGGVVALVMTRNVERSPSAFYSVVLASIGDALSAAGFAFAYRYADGDDPAALEALLAEGGFAAALLVGMFDEVSVAALTRQGFPFVVVDHHVSVAGACCVASDNVDGATTAIAHLAERGHRRIGFVATHLRSSFLERFEGYCLALAERGLRLERAHTVRALSLDDPVAALRPVLTSAERPTAIFAANDAIAAAVLRVARRLGLSVPDDLAVIGFDDDSIAAQIDPPLSTIAVPRQEMGRQAVRRLLRRIGGASPAAVRLPVALVERASVADPAPKPATRR